jgi:hypothetical protein
MDKTFKFLFGRDLSTDEDEDKKKSEDFRAPDGFNPSDSSYDPHTRLKRQLRRFFPHLLGTPGLPPALKDESDER